MASYQIQVRSCSNGTHDLRVLLVDDCEQPVGVLDALNRDHARMIAFDLMSLARQRDPMSTFVVDTYVLAGQALDACTNAVAA